MSATPRNWYGRHDPAGEPQPAHERVLRRGDVEEALVLEQEDVGALGEPPVAGVLAATSSQMSSAVLLALGLLLGEELLALGELRSWAAMIGSPPPARRPLRAGNPAARGLACQVGRLRSRLQDRQRPSERQ